MPKIISLTLFISISIINIPVVTAQTTRECSLTTNPAPIVTKPDSDSLAIGTRIAYSIRAGDPGNYNVYLQRGKGPFGDYSFRDLVPNSEGILVNSSGQPPDIVIDGQKATSGAFKANHHIIEVERQGAPGNYCIARYDILTVNSASQLLCNIRGPLNPNSTTAIIYSGTLSPVGQYRFWLPQLEKEVRFSPDSSGQVTQNLGVFNPGTYTVKVQKESQIQIQAPDGSFASIPSWEDTNCSMKDLQVDSVGENPTPDTTPTEVGTGTPASPALPETVIKQCKQRDDPSFTERDIPCITSSVRACGTDGIETAIGCIPTNPQDLVRTLLKFLVAISGGIAFLLMVLGAFGMITSAGNPENLEASKDRFSKAIIGLLTVVFAVLLLKVIGVDILGLGAFLGV